METESQAVIFQEIFWQHDDTAVNPLARGDFKYKSFTFVNEVTPQQ